MDELAKDEAPPDVDTVRRKLRAGQALAERMTVGEWLDRWTAQEAGTHRKATDISYESHIRLYLKPKIGDVRIDRLTVGQVKEMFNKICDDNDAIEANNADRRALLAHAKQASGRAEKRRLRAAVAELPPFRRAVSPSSRKRIQATLRAALNDAITQQVITFNPAEHVHIPSKTPKRCRGPPNGWPSGGAPVSGLAR
ncbi:hypothetical protein ACTG9Q_00545 [Actinokineospora sp. 24-640]